MPTLDVEAVKIFLIVAELKSFTRAAELLGTTQGAVSVKLKRLEERLGCRLIERTPRFVRLSAQGYSFLEGARDFIAAHERAVAGLVTPRRHFALGIGGHIAGPEVPALLACLHAQDPALTIEVRLENSRVLLDQFDRGELDAAIVHRQDDRRDGETLSHERLGWFAVESYVYCPNEPLRVATLAPTCNIRNIAAHALDTAGIDWVETFQGGGTSALLAAVSTGLAVAVLSCRVAPPNTVDVGERFGLPPLPMVEVVLHSSLTDQRSRDALRALAAAFREHRPRRD